MVTTYQDPQSDFKGLILHKDKQDVRRANYAALKHWYAALGARAIRPATIFMHGDSLTEGRWATAKDKTWARLLGDSIQRMYRVGGAGWQSIGTYLTPWSLVGGSTDTSTSSGIGRFSRSMTTGNTATMTFTGDRLWLLFTGSSGSGTAAVSIDGVSAGTFATSNATLRTMKWDSGVIAEGILGKQHTVVVSWSSGGTVMFDGGFVFDTDYGKGVHVWEAGHTGFMAGDFTDSSLAHWTAMRPDLIRPDLVIIQFGGNEQGNAVSASTFKTNIETLIDRYRNALDPDPSIILMSIWARGDGGATESAWLPYRQALREVMLSKNVGYFDLYDLGGWMGQTGTDQVGDLVTTNGSAIVTSATAYFRNVDVGMGISGTGIPASTTVLSRQSATQVTMSANATASAPSGITATFTNRPDPERFTDDLVHLTDSSSQMVADELSRIFVGQPKHASIPQGTADAKGDMLVATGADNWVRMPPGREGQVPTNAPSHPLGMIHSDPGITSRIIQILPNPGLATVNFVGLAAAPTVTSPTAASTADQADGTYVQINTTTTVNTDCSVATPFTILRPSWIPEFGAIIRTGGLTNIRIFVGMFSASPLTAADPAIHGAGFRYDTGADGTAFWRTWTNDGTSTGTVKTTTKAIAVTTKYRLRIVAVGAVGTNATAYWFYIDDELVSIHTTDLPGGTTANLGMFFGARVLTAGTSKSILFGRMANSYV